MQEIMQEIESIEQMTINNESGAGGGQKVTKMDDLLREIKRLSAQMKEGKSDSSNKEEEVYTSHSTSAKRMAKKRQKRRKQNNHGRKRRLKYQVDTEIASSSFTECTDEEILKDYIENITTNLSDSEVELTLRKGMFLARQELSSPHNFPRDCRLSPEIYETDSLNESFRLTQSRKKRRKYKRHSLESFDSHLPTAVTPHQKSLIQNCLKQQYSKNLKKLKTDSMCLDEDGEVLIDDSNNKMKAFLQTSQDSLNQHASENSESSSNSHLGSEADDEGEESCWESSSPIKQIIPWWEEKEDQAVGTEPMDNDNYDGPPEIDLSLTSTNGNVDLKTRLKQYATPLDVLCESGGFAAYANHKIRKFIQDRDSSELSLYTTNKREQDQVGQLSTLYNLQYCIEENGRSSKVALVKTRHTKEADQDSLKLFLGRVVKLKCRKVRRPTKEWNEYKRRKVVLQQPHQDHPSFNSELIDIPIPDSNVGNQMLRGMGWKPGQGLGKDKTGQIFPVKATKRPKKLGFGHPGGT